MKSSSIINKFELFMTKKDEFDFSKEIKEKFPNVVFIDRYAWTSGEAPIRDFISECYSALNSGCILLNTSILSIFDYESFYVKKHAIVDIYHGAITGNGLIQIEHSRPANYSPGGLKGGFISCSYDADKEDGMDEFAKGVFKLCKKIGETAHRIDPLTLKVSTYPSRKTVALPDAIQQYDQVNDQFLTMFASNYYTTKIGSVAVTKQGPVER